MILTRRCRTSVSRNELRPRTRSIGSLPQFVEALDYLYQGEGGIPGRHFFRKPIDISHTGRAYHLHMVEKGHDQWAMYQLFREYMLLHPESVQQYDALKRELATKYGSDRAAYTDMKASFIRSIIRAAVVEAMSEKKKTANKESL